MGVSITELLIRHEIEISELRNKKLAVDAFNNLYQYLSSIRMADGSLLMDSQGNVTSHLAGLFSRTTNLMQQGLKLAFVFDGKTPKLKQREKERRSEIKKQALLLHKEAVEKKDIDAMKKYASRTSMLTNEIINEAKELIKALGLPVIDAPSEGEAQAAYMVRKSDLFGLVSQDMDCLLFGAPRLVRNLTITQRKKRANKLGYLTLRPELIDLNENLKSLGIDQDQLIVLGMLIGTDYNPGGIKGIGPKNALKLVKEFKQDFNGLLNKVKWQEQFDFSWDEVFGLFKRVPTTDDYELKWAGPCREKVIELLCEKHDFARQRIEKVMEELEKKKTKDLNDFFKTC